MVVLSLFSIWLFLFSFVSWFYKYTVFVMTLYSGMHNYFSMKHSMFKGVLTGKYIYIFLNKTVVR